MPCGWSLDKRSRPCMKSGDVPGKELKDTADELEFVRDGVGVARLGTEWMMAIRSLDSGAAGR